MLCRAGVATVRAWDTCRTPDNRKLHPQAFPRFKSTLGPWGGVGEYPPNLHAARSAATDTDIATDRFLVDAVRQLLAAIDRNSEYVAGILHGAAHREQLDSLQNAIDRASDQAAVWQRPKGGGRQWHTSNKAPPREPSPSAPSAPSTARTQQSTGASSSTHTAPPVVTPTMVPPNVTAVTWDQLQDMMGRMLDARLAATGSAVSTTTDDRGAAGADGAARATDGAGAQGAGASTDNDNTDSAGSARAQGNSAGHDRWAAKSPVESIRQAASATSFARH